MSKIALASNADGTGTLTIAAPNTDTDRTLNLPDAGGEVVTNTATQTLTNKTIQGGALTRATATTASGTSVEFTSIPSWVKRITLMLNGVSTNGSSVVQLQLGSGSFTTSGYAGGFSAVSGTTVAGSNFTTGVVVQPRADAGNLSLGKIEICLLTGTTYVAVGSIYNASYGGYATTTGGSIALSGVLDRIRVTTVNGTDAFDAGTINIMYEG